jgi:hypothetical protein
MEDNSAAQGSRSTRFRQGSGGNRKGRRAGSRNAKTVLVDGIMSDRAKEIAEKAVALALDGNSMALRLCLERIAPARKDRPISFAMPAIGSPADAAKASAALVAAVASGELTPSEAGDLGKLIEGCVKTLETADIEARVRKLEEAAR